MDDNTSLMFDAETIDSWVNDKVSTWGDHWKTNYEESFEEYYRLWRGIWANEDKTRASERSRLISPALQQAVESSVAEIEEATFGRGAFFTIRDDIKPPEGAPATEEEAMVLQQAQAKVAQDKLKISYLTSKLNQDFTKARIRKSVGEVLLNSAIYGTGIAEIVIDTVPDLKPMEMQNSEGMFEQGVAEGEKTLVTMRPIQPQNFKIDPLATSIEDSIGVAIEEFVSPHSIQLLQEDGVYRQVEFGATSGEDSILDADPTLTDQPDDKVRLTKYFGLVPRHLFDKFNNEDVEELSEVELEIKKEMDDDGEIPAGLEDLQDIIEGPYYIEAMVILANRHTVLKCVENDFYLKDRPVIAFPWDIVPGRFWGRGVCEKGYSSQKALDTEIRARIDGLALTNAPMMAVDSTRLMRGSKAEIRPGKIILTNGDPREVLQPFKFGEISNNSFVQAEALQKMVQTATGAIDSAGFAGSINGEATASGISMSLGAIIKRHKRTLVNFQQAFLIPFVKKAACRYMQFSPEKYPVKDYDFEVTSSLGIVAREYEVTQLVQLLQTMGQDTPLYPLLVKAIIENMQVSNREELIRLIDQAAQPDPEAQEAAKADLEAKLAFSLAQTKAMAGQGSESEARAAKIAAETKAIPLELENERVRSLAALAKVDNDLDRNDKYTLKMAETFVKEKSVANAAAKNITNE